METATSSRRHHASRDSNGENDDIKHENSGTTRLISLMSIVCMAMALIAIRGWHGTSEYAKKPHHYSATPAKRSLLDWSDGSDNNPDIPFDDDGTRTDICKNFIKTFLNGTTDVNDECQAIYNAYEDSECEKEKHRKIDDNNNNDGFTLWHQHEDNNGTVEDDALIDDFFEHWECCDSIERLYERNCKEEEGLHSIRLLGIMLVLLVCTIIKAMTKRFGVHWLPDACAFIIVGALVGGILRLSFGNAAVERKLSFDNDLFLQILLPPIIFQAALSIDKRAFRRDLFPILAFASVGTAFSAIAIGLVTHYVSSFMGDGAALPMIDSLVFGSLISSIDPVATLGILSQVGVSQTDTLYVLIFGESLLNDGVAIVLFDTLKGYLGDEATQLESSAYQKIIFHFVAILVGSIVVGLLCGILCTIYFWALRGRQNAVTEVMIFFTWSLIPYYIADGLGCSGIIAIMVMGFFLDYYVIGGFQSEENTWMDYMARRSEAEQGMPRLGPPGRWDRFCESMAQAFSGRGHILSRSRHHVGFVAHVIATLMDTAIFAYLGLFLFNDNVWHLRLSVTAILGCVSSRAIMVIVLSMVINIFVFLDVESTLGRFVQGIRRVNPIMVDDDDNIERTYLDKKTQLILLLAGVRGAVSFALVENIPVYDSVTKLGSKFKPELKAMTSSSIVFTLFIFGALTYFTVEFGSGRQDRVAGNLTHRLLSDPLDSDDEGQTSADEQSEINSLALEVEHQYAPNPRSFQAQAQQKYIAPTQASIGLEQQQQQEQHPQQMQQHEMTSAPFQQNL